MTNHKDKIVDATIGRIKSDLVDISTISVKSFGADSTGVSDSTTAIQNALNYSTTGLRYVKIPDGDYLVNPYTKLHVQSNTKLEFSKNARLIAINTNHDISSMLDVRNVENVEIINPVIIGDRDTNTAVTEGAGHGITCIGVKNLKISGGNISKCFTDGIYINTVENCLIEFVTCDSNRRQGMSVTCSNNFLCRNSTFINTNGVAPQMGVDIEPNGVNDYLRNIKFENIYTGGNASSGIGINLNQQNNTDTVIDITIDKWTDSGSAKAFSCTKYQGDISEMSTILVRDLKANNNKDCAIHIAGYKSDGNARLILEKPRVYNCNVNNGTNERNQNVAISITSETTGYPVGTVQGNIDIVEPYIDMASGRSLLRGIYIGYIEPYKKISVINPKKINTGSTTLSQNNNYSKLTFLGAGQGDVFVQDKYNALSLISNYSLIKGYGNAYYSKFICNATSGSVTFQDFNNWNVTTDEVLVINNNSGGINCIVKIPTISGITFVDESNSDLTSKIYTSSVINSVLRFKKVSDSLIKVYKENGTWTVT